MLDIIVFGATGFTGQYVTKYIAKNGEPKRSALKWGIAGRSKDKLQELIARLSKELQKDLSHIQIIEADVASEQSISQMCGETRVLINCVGPFQRWGEVVVKSCIEKGTDYVDITGEPLFIDSMIYKYNAKAEEKGCTIVPSCGFDSVPADLGVLHATMQFKEPSLCYSVESYLHVKPGPKGLAGNYGTYDSLIDGFANVKKLIAVRKQMNRPSLPNFGPPIKRITGSSYSDRLQRYVLPFPGSDATVVKNTQYYFVVHPNKYPKPVQFAAYFTVASFWSVALLGLFDVMLRFLVRFSWGKSLLKNYPSFFTFGAFSKAGPTKEQIETASFSTSFVAKGFQKYDPATSATAKPDWKVETKVSGPEVGYVTTPICVCEAAFTLLDLKKSGNIPAGVLSPAVAFAKTDYISRLNQNGVEFSLVNVGPM